MGFDVTEVSAPHPDDVTHDLVKNLSRLSYHQAIRLTPATLAFALSEGRWQPAPHLLFMAGEVANDIRGGDARTIFSAPARHGKSELFSVYTPTWFLDQWAERQIMLTSYNADLPIGFSRRVRDLIAQYGGIAKSQYAQALSSQDPNSPAFLPGLRRHLLRCRLRADVRQVNQWQTSKDGSVYAVGIGGSLTGRGSHLFLMDDYIKNAEEAESEVVRDSIWEWFVSTAFTRLEPGGSMFIVATRWNIDDLIGRIEHMQISGQLEDMAPGAQIKPWKIVRLPALSEGAETDPLGRKRDEPLWPERFSLSRLLETRALQGKYYWAAMYQQKPIKREDATATPEDIIWVDVLPYYTRLRKCRAWDFAGTKDAGDATSGTLMAADGPAKSTGTNYYLEDIVHDHLASTEVEKLVLATAQADGFDTSIAIEQEPGSSGKAYAEYIAFTILKDYKVTIYPKKSSKWLAAQPLMACIANKHFHAKRAPNVPSKWNKKFTSELRTFPGGPSDDTIDSTSLAYNHLNDENQISVTWGRASQRPADTTQGRVVRGTQTSVRVGGACWGRPSIFATNKE